MLKLPKGLKKKKKGKKSKKDQELFTEEELAQYKREHAHHEQEAEEHQPEKSTNDDEWSQFAALTTGIDSVLKKTQGDLDRIKESSFFKRVPPPSEKKVDVPPEPPVEIEEPKVEQTKAEQLLNAVVELSDSDDDESIYDDSAFDTTFTEAELPLGYVQDSPEEEVGPDPFDTGYAEKVIKGPEVSTRGKKIVNIGAAVGVLTGKVDTTVAASKSRRQRRGIQNLMLESFELNLEGGEGSTDLDPVMNTTTILDEPAELGDDIPIDLTKSMHLPLIQKQKQEQEDGEGLQMDEHADDIDDVLSKVEITFSKIKDDPVQDSTDWSEFEVDEKDKPKPQRPPPPTRPAKSFHLKILLGEDSEEEDLSEVDVFDTAFVEKVIPKAIDYDDDFDPRGDDDEDMETGPVESLAAPALKKDLLSNSHTNLSDMVPTMAPSVDVEEEEVEIDPFDTSAVNALVAPGKAELKYLEQELLNKKDSLSDDDFDPRAGEEEPQPDLETLRQRKSSLSLQITSNTSKLVSFSVATPDLLRTDGELNSKIPKPLTPYYTREPSLTLDEEPIPEDPFDTSFVKSIKPSAVELHLIEKEMLKQPALQHSLSDDDFDPRAFTPAMERKPQSDLLTAHDDHDIKVLTPAKDSNSPSDIEIDPFDTSIACNILPGTTELKLLEDELLEKKPEVLPPTDLISDTQDNSIYAKLLTPQPTGSIDMEADEDFDPFDTSFAANLAPGEVEIKMIENELIN